MDKFYVYAYLDPRHAQTPPFYIGKGFDNRAYHGLSEAKLIQQNNRMKIATVRKIREVGLDPIVVILEENLTEDEAFSIEDTLIKLIGKICNKTGPLTNLLEGPRGLSGRVWSEDSKRAQSERFMGHLVSEETRQKLSMANTGKRTGKENHMFGKTHSVETWDKIKKKLKGRISPRKGVKLSQETIKKMLDNRPDQSGENNPYAGNWKIYTEDGANITYVKGLAKYCRENNLSDGALRAIAYKIRDGKQPRSYKGLFCERLD